MSKLKDAIFRLKEVRQQLVAAERDAGNEIDQVIAVLEGVSLDQQSIAAANKKDKKRIQELEARLSAIQKFSSSQLEKSLIFEKQT